MLLAQPRSEILDIVPDEQMEPAERRCKLSFYVKVSACQQPEGSSEPALPGGGGLQPAAQPGGLHTARCSLNHACLCPCAQTGKAWAALERHEEAEMALARATELMPTVPGASEEARCLMLLLLPLICAAA
jgi:hypothetical protein